MAGKIGLIGHCGADTAYLRIAIRAARNNVPVVTADDEESLQELIDSGADLLLINRVLDYGFDTDCGIELIKRLREKNPSLKMMLVSNHSDAQQAAVAAGALHGFGKSQIGRPQVAEILRHALG
jgi:DNA-binding NarL/FixJ family response regulator